MNIEKAAFGGRVLFLDRSDINTDEIIPAKYLTELTKRALKPHLLEDLILPGFDQRETIRNCGAIVTRRNFGCGSSREHAPWALQQNGIRLVVAESFARIFRQNMFNGGMLAVELEPEKIEQVFALQREGSAIDVAVDLPSRILSFSRNASSGDGNATAPAVLLSAGFELTSFQAKLVESGGWVDLANALY